MPASEVAIALKSSWEFISFAIKIPFLYQLYVSILSSELAIIEALFWAPTHALISVGCCVIVGPAVNTVNLAVAEVVTPQALVACKA